MSHELLSNLFTIPEEGEEHFSPPIIPLVLQAKLFNFRFWSTCNIIVKATASSLVSIDLSLARLFVAHNISSKEGHEDELKLTLLYDFLLPTRKH